MTTLHDQIKNLDKPDAMLRVFAAALDPWCYLKSAQHYLEISLDEARTLAKGLEARGLLESAPGEFGPRWRITVAGGLRAATTNGKRPLQSRVGPICDRCGQPKTLTAIEGDPVAICYPCQFGQEAPASRS